MRALGFLVVKRPDEPTAVRRYTTTQVMGQDGELYKDTGLYEDVTQSIDFNFMSDRDHWSETLRRFRQAVINAKKLQFSDDPHFYRKIKKVEIDKCERTTTKIGTITVNFVMDPYHYSVPGDIFYSDHGEYDYNRGDICRPVYEITGIGHVSLTVNGYTCHVECNGGPVYLDTGLYLCYGDGTTNADTDAEYEKLYLQPGHNDISCSANLRVQPRWREL